MFSGVKKIKLLNLIPLVNTFARLLQDTPSNISANNEIYNPDLNELNS